MNDAERFWDEKYGAADRLWSGKPNAALVRQVGDLEPGTALDLGSGEGGDAVWLAHRGWRVTAVDISQVALDRAAAHAVEEGVADRIQWRRHDLAESFPEGTYDLVCAQFLHAPADIDFPRERVLRDAAAAVAPGGVLLIIGHAGPPSWAPDADLVLPEPQEVFDGLGLPASHWKLEVSQTHREAMTGPDGQPASRTDGTLKIRRLDD
ncbi:SAM-dependent methyltransferase [Spirillospora sp. CA-294931]|uniref:SAM-dependent methyltransferase n=1 Tax=Spirillospora sp. CA-294931 TaxID=3240042 RepID=UPI003D914595